MSILFKLGIIEIDYTMIISFLIGIVIGAILICLIYAVIVVASLGSKNFIVKTEDDTLQASEVKDMIILAQKSFKDKSLRAGNSKVTHCKNLCKDLVYGIATRFYPKSKHPLFELSVDEIIRLIGYIQQRVDELLGRRGLRLLKKINIATVVGLTEKTNQVMESKAFKVSKEISGAVSVIKRVINVINPAWWGRKLFIDKTIDIILNKLCLVIIAVVGEETYKIYSKTVFKQDVEIESNVDELIQDLDLELIEAKKDVNTELIISEPGDLNKNHAMYKKKIYTQNKIENSYKSIFDSKASCKKQS